MHTFFYVVCCLSIGGTISQNLVAKFAHQATGVTVTSKDRIFVTFPRWTEDSPISLAEIDPITGVITAYPPNTEWNSWRNVNKNKLNASLHFVCVQSVVAHPNGESLWVLDPAAPALGFIVSHGPKLVEIDLETNAVRRIILFDTVIAPQGSYLNDVRFHDSYAYITDSGVTGALVIVNLNNGQARRVLHGHPSTQIDPIVTIAFNGIPLRRADGRGVEFSADGIALSPDGSTLYWQALTGKTLYSIDTSSLHQQLSDRQLENRVRNVGENGPADGLLISRRFPDRLFITSIENGVLLVRNLSSNKITLFSDQIEYNRCPVKHTITWPDTLAEGPDGSIYVTASHIQESAIFNRNAPIQLMTELWRFQLNESNVL